ncbi:hypothetical protein SBA3_1890011 [Candidatus Sulfopaludibacter sp. SbA3]|nr:hypothetical protein SBA3_1890011 [Candidatus Sulfopaludibacter sp. SbA3]
MNFRGAVRPLLTSLENANYVYAAKRWQAIDFAAFAKSVASARIALRRQTTKNDRLSHGAKEFSSGRVRHRLVSQRRPHFHPAAGEKAASTSGWLVAMGLGVAS